MIYLSLLMKAHLRMPVITLIYAHVTTIPIFSTLPTKLYDPIFSTFTTHPIFSTLVDPPSHNDRWWVGGCIFWCARGPRPGPGPGSRGPGLALEPGSPRAHQKNAATNPPPRREIIDDSSIFGQSFNHTPNHNLNHKIIIIPNYG